MSQPRTREKRLKKLQQANDGIYVTDHALIRYMERVLKMDLETIRKQIVGDKLKEVFRRFGNGKFPLDGLTYIVKDGLVLTVMTRDGQQP